MQLCSRAAVELDKHAYMWPKQKAMQLCCHTVAELSEHAYMYETYEQLSYYAAAESNKHEYNMGHISKQMQICYDSAAESVLL